MENEKNALRTDAENNTKTITTKQQQRVQQERAPNTNTITTKRQQRVQQERPLFLWTEKYERKESALTVRGTVFAPPTGHKAKNNALSCHTSPAPLILTLTCLVSANMCFLRGGASVVQKLFSRSRPTARPLERNVNIKGAGGIKPTRLHQWVQHTWVVQKLFHHL